MGEERYGYAILDLGTRFNSVVSFTARPLCTREVAPPRCPVSTRLVGSQRPRSGEERNLTCRESAIQPIAGIYTH